MGFAGVEEMAVRALTAKFRKQNRFSAVEGIVDEVLEKIKNSGIRLGNRWIIREEGTGSYEALVFRDLVSSGDTRYAMFKGRKTNL